VVSFCPGCGTIAAFWNGGKLADFNDAAAKKLTKQIVQLPIFATVQPGTVSIMVTSSRKPVEVDGLSPTSLDESRAIGHSVANRCWRPQWHVL
jgi:hypothetical protein